MHHHNQTSRYKVPSLPSPTTNSLLTTILIHSSTHPLNHPNTNTNTNQPPTPPTFKMKPTTLLTTLFATLALAAPAAENPATGAIIAEGSLPMRRDVVQTLDKRGCPDSSSCQQGQCYWWSCSGSGWCTANPSGIKC